MDVRGMIPEVLAQTIRSAGRPLHVNVLARAWLAAQAGGRRYAPGSRYRPEETIILDGQQAVVEAVERAKNPIQGTFAILTLRFPDGTKRLMAAEVPGAPAEDRRPVTDEQVRRILEEHGPAIRAAVQEALAADDRFVWFQDAQGDHWCLAEMLPKVGDEELARVWPMLQGLLADGILHPRPTEALVKAIWGQENDGSNDYLLKAFALNVALWRCQDVRQMGDGWVLEAEWRQLQERPMLVGPRQQNVVTLPDGVAPVEEDEEETGEVEEGEEPPEEETVVEEDLETWRRNRLRSATITLRAQHYYGNWLPLTRAMRRVFPPRASGADAVTFYHRFGGEEESFPAWVDWDQRRILGSPEMYQAFYEHGIYPGARLVISHRGSEREYEIRTKPVEGEQRVLVRRVSLAEDGTLEYEEVEEPVRYEVDENEFVTSARWEDLDALFRQAEGIGAGIFQLMYEKCREWWEENDRRPLYVTTDDLFRAIHFDDERGRLTSKATIAWELWRRLAFEPVGGGRYRFRPEFGDRVRSVGPRRRAQKLAIILRGPQVKKDSSLEEVARRAQVGVTMRDLWSELRADEQKEAALQAAARAYMEDPAREKVLFLRQVAHRRIRELVAKDRLKDLTLDEFNRQVWQLGSIMYQGRRFRIDSEDAETVLGAMSIEELRAAYESGELEIEGNQTWGSYSSVIGSRLDKSDSEMERVVRDTLHFLLHGEGPIEDRMHRIIREPNGFGMNVISGILHAVFPEEHVLYNSRSVDALNILGISWPADWQRNVDTYVSYKDFCHQLRECLGFRSLTDVDWFMYNLATGQIGWQRRGENEAFLLGLISGKGEIDRSANTVKITLQYGRYKHGWIKGGGIAFREEEVLPRGAQQVYARLKQLATTHDSLKNVVLHQRNLYRYEIILEFSDRHGLFDLILSWYPVGSSYATFRFPTAKLQASPVEFAKVFMQGYACATGLITDTTRAGPAGRHRVFIRAATANKEILNDVRWLLEQRLNVPVASIHWHEGRDPQLRVYAENFEAIGFGLDWEDRILAACAHENRREFSKSSQNQSRLPD